MDETIELLSSMSPKIKNNHKVVKKGTVLALKKHFRRSSLYDKSVRTVKNEDLNIVESSTSTSTSNSACMLNEVPIIISDTDLSDDSSVENKNVRKEIDKKSPMTKQNVLSNYPLSANKINEIHKWIANIDREKVSDRDTTTFTEQSTIYDDAGLIFKAKEKGNAVNSTHVDSGFRRFDELFRSNERQRGLNVGKRSSPKWESTQEIINQSFRNMFIRGSLNSSNESLTTRLKKVTRRRVNKYTCEKPKGTKTQRNKNDSLVIDKEKDEDIIEGDVETLLDSFYGNKWREKRDLVLPKTEPKNKVKSRLNNMPNTERKPTLSSLYKNPYLEAEQLKSDNLLQSLQKSRLRLNLETPLTQRLNALCDSGTNSENSNTPPPPPRTRLSFSDSCDEDSEENRKTSKYFTKKTDNLDDDNGSSCKEDFEVSDLGQTLEERIRKKVFKINDVPEVIKSNTKKDAKKKVVRTESNTDPVNKISKNKNIVGRSLKKSDTNKKLSTSSASISSDEEWDKEISKIKYKKPATGQYSFLASLSGSVPISKCDMTARIYRNNFSTFKDQLLAKLFTLYNEKVFNNAISQDTTLEWSDKMRRTAGFCYCKKITRRSGAVERSVRIVLATKVIDSADRLRDTLIHEMCHAAAWIVNCVSDGHGKFWKSWAFKAMQTFPELPPIKRCHAYEINTKYTYKCTGCGYSIGRHSKSLDVERKRCGHCYGKFELLLNKTSKTGEVKSVPATPKKEASGFALFVKENYGIYKNSQVKHGDVMKMLGQKFQEMKVKK